MQRTTSPTPRRFGQVIGLRADSAERYRRLHAEVWPEVLRTITACHIRNYTIFERDGLLFAYFEYHGTDWQADQARMAADPATRRWWEETDPLQRPVDSAGQGEWWVDMEEVFHHD